VLFTLFYGYKPPFFGLFRYSRRNYPLALQIGFAPQHVGQGGQAQKAVLVFGQSFVTKLGVAKANLQVQEYMFDFGTTRREFVMNGQ
jgi:hypothetical protein